MGIIPNLFLPAKALTVSEDDGEANLGNDERHASGNSSLRYIGLKSHTIVSVGSEATYGSHTSEKRNGIVRVVPATPPDKTTFIRCKKRI